MPFLLFALTLQASAIGSDPTHFSLPFEFTSLRKDENWGGKNRKFAKGSLFTFLKARNKAKVCFEQVAHKNHR